MELQKAIKRFHQFGGWRLLREYSRLGLFSLVAKETVSCVLKRKSFKQIYPALEKKLLPFLYTKYKPLVEERIAHYSKNSSQGLKSDKIWFCWLQGMDKAPELVKTCLNSVKKYNPLMQVVVLDRNNIADFVTLDPIIVQKYAKGIIPHALYADIVRLELLIRYGGLWIDSTVLCTDAIPSDILDSELFFFQYRNNATGHFAGISNWFIKADSDNIVLKVLRDVLVKYWADYDCVLNYYMFHRFFGYIAHFMPETVRNMPVHLSVDCLCLENAMAQAYDPVFWAAITQKSTVHKLNYRLSEDVLRDRDNNYNFIVNQL